jgi:hypothetical protein
VVAERRGGGLRAAGTMLPKVAGPILGKRGLGAGRLIAEWAAIVGTELAAQAAPVKLAFPPGERTGGTLRLRVAPAAAVELQHRAPVIVERINAALGYAAVARLSFVQAPLPQPKRAPAPRALEPAEAAALERQLEAVEDPALREALGRLGRAVIGDGRRG